MGRITFSDLVSFLLHILEALGLSKLVKLTYWLFKSKQLPQDLTSCGVMPNVATCDLVPVSVNYHFTRQCNYSCGFCFHTAKTSYVLPEQEAKKGLNMLKEAGMKKVNFSGGEPFLVKGGRFLGELVRYCKEDLEMESVSVVSNGSKITEKWMAEYGYYLDILAVSCDSFRAETNERIGRRAGTKGGGQSHLDSLEAVRNWCQSYGVLFKINTVVNKFNFNEDMRAEIQRLAPIRWKVFQCLDIEAENLGKGALRQVEPFLLQQQEWQQFLQRHAGIHQMVPENNQSMRNSYLILDEYMRFLDNTGGRKEPSPSILDVGVHQALDRAGFDEAMFYKRGGRYKWSKLDSNLDW